MHFYVNNYCLRCHRTFSFHKGAANPKKLKNTKTINTDAWCQTCYLRIFILIYIRSFYQNFKECHADFYRKLFQIWEDFDQSQRSCDVVRFLVTKNCVYIQSSSTILRTNTVLEKKWQLLVQILSRIEEQVLEARRSWKETKLQVSGRYPDVLEHTTDITNSVSERWQI